jgi:type IV pilus assembly protein PilF
MKRAAVLSGLILGLLSACATTGGGGSQGERQFEDTANPYKPHKLSTINAQLGIAYMQRGDYQIAMQKLQKAVEQDEQNPEAHTGLALLYGRLGQTGLIARHYERALQLEPNNSSTHNNYASFLCQQGNIPEAEAHFQQALENPLYKTPELAYTNAGLCALRSQRQTDAERYFRKALEADSRFPVALYQLADLHAQRNESVEAQALYARYLAVAPQTAQTLWLGVRIAAQTGDKNAAASYALLLRSKFPEAEETQLLKTLDF